MRTGGWKNILQSTKARKCNGNSGEEFYGVYVVEECRYKESH